MPAPRLVADAIDTLLELTVVGSFSRLGPVVRGRLAGWTDPPRDALAGRTAVVTGPTSGLGRATAEALARLGARVVLVGRDRGRLDATANEIAEATGRADLRIVVADLADLAEVGAIADEIATSEPRVDLLVDNAGGIFSERRVGADGIEATFGLMVVAPFVLTAGLLERLRQTHGRTIAVTSGGQYTQGLDLDDLALTRLPWSGPRAYARAKRAQVALIREWDRRAGDAVSFVAMHPGWADTPGLEASLPGFRRLMRPILRTPAEGIDTTVWLAAHPEARGAAVDGRLVLDRRARPFDRLPVTRLRLAERRELWDRVVAMAGIADPAPEPARRVLPDARRVAS
jgi:NAD(P)-dependent dehydrogenase (short-subunit alcohol dehydrogenase family)